MLINTHSTQPVTKYSVLMFFPLLIHIFDITENNIFWIISVDLINIITAQWLSFVTFII